MISTSEALRDALHSRGLAPFDATGPIASTTDAATSIDVATNRAIERPWYISVLLGVSGWLAGLFLLGFVAILFHPESAASAALCAVVLLAAAWGLFNVDREGAFVAQFALALSIAGQCLMVFAMTEHTHGIAAIAFATLLLQTVLAVVMPNRLHRMLSTFFAAIAWALVVRFGLVGEPDFWRGSQEIRVPLSTALVAWLSAWLPFGTVLWMTIRREAHWMARGWQPVLRPILSGAILGLAFATLASQPFESFRWLGDGDASVDGLAMWPLLSAAGAFAAMAAAFALRNRALIIASAVAALLHVSHFYYELGASLLIKSLIMLAMGGAMLLVARLLNRGVHA
jgi:Domain of unknown function (DUF4401)